MIKLKASGLDIYFDETSKKLSFSNGVYCTSSIDKYAGQMRDLLACADNLCEDEYYYSAYRDIGLPIDTELFLKHDLRYDITVIDEGTINGERKKTSGHYHGYIPNQMTTYPEIYEVLYGTAIYILQRVGNFDQDQQPIIDDVRAVTVEAGQAIIIPPFYGHCSINGGDKPLVFSNLAVISCPLLYQPISDKHGLSYYLIEKSGQLNFVKNNHYQSIPHLINVTPKADTDLGITFGLPIYQSFINFPNKYAFLTDPNSYYGDIMKLIQK